MLLALPDLLTCIRAYLTRKSEFSAVRSFVFQFFEAEKDMELDDNLEEIFPILLSYLHYDEAEGDPDRDKRLRRLLDVLEDHQDSIRERVVFGLEFDDIRELTKKRMTGVIPANVYDEQMAKLAPLEYDYKLVEAWGDRHINEEDPVPEKLK